MEQSSKHNPRIWVGTEVEGRLKGLKTLFIACSIDKEFFGHPVGINAICQKHHIHHLYFNAGKTNFNEYTHIEYFLNRGYFVTIETTDPQDIPTALRFNIRLHIIWRISENHLDLIKHTDTIKIEGRHGIYCTTPEQMVKTKWTDYNDDQVIC